MPGYVEQYTAGLDRIERQSIGENIDYREWLQDHERDIRSTHPEMSRREILARAVDKTVNEISAMQQDLASIEHERHSARFEQTRVLSHNRGLERDDMEMSL